MVSILTLALTVLPALYFYNYYRCFARNLAAAKASNLVYVIEPVYVFQRFWLITHRIWMPLLYMLPRKYTDPWLDFLSPDWLWKHLHGPFEKLGTDMFLTVSPGRNVLWCANASAISQITTRRNDFPKPIEIYGSVDVYGKNVVSTEGAIWRQHRKITSPPFTEKNNHLVWAESLHQAQSMVKSWVGPDGLGNRTIAKVADDTMRLSLHVISRAGFGVRLLWPGIEDTVGKEEIKANGPAAGQATTDIPKGHRMSYTDALGSLLHNILWLFLLPRWLLSAFHDLLFLTYSLLTYVSCSTFQKN